MTQITYGHVFHDIAISGHARAIFGDVHVSCPDFLEHLTPIQKRRGMSAYSPVRNVLILIGVVSLAQCTVLRRYAPSICAHRKCQAQNMRLDLVNRIRRLACRTTSQYLVLDLR